MTYEGHTLRYTGTDFFLTGSPEAAPIPFLATNSPPAPPPRAPSLLGVSLPSPAPPGNGFCNAFSLPHSAPLLPPSAPPPPSPPLPPLSASVSVSLSVCLVCIARWLSSAATMLFVPPSPPTDGRARPRAPGSAGLGRWRGVLCARMNALSSRTLRRAWEREGRGDERKPHTHAHTHRYTHTHTQGTAHMLISKFGGVFCTHTHTHTIRA
jgi:hypothetical protein